MGPSASGAWLLLPPPRSFKVQPKHEAQENSAGVHGAPDSMTEIREDVETTV